MSHGVGPDCAKFICRRSGGREIFSVEPSTDYSGKDVEVGGYAILEPENFWLGLLIRSC